MNSGLPASQSVTFSAGIHHARFGFLLKERMEKLGIECQVRLRQEYGGDRTPQMFRDMVAFFQKYFPQVRPRPRLPAVRRPAAAPRRRALRSGAASCSRLNRLQETTGAVESTAGSRIGDRGVSARVPDICQ